MKRRKIVKSTVVTKKRLDKIWKEWVHDNEWPERTFQIFLLKKLRLI